MNNILSDCQDLYLTIETKSKTYFGKLVNVDDYLNIELENVFIKGDEIVFIVLPGIMEYCPLIK